MKMSDLTSIEKYAAGLIRLEERRFGRWRRAWRSQYVNELIEQYTFVRNQIIFGTTKGNLTNQESTDLDHRRSELRAEIEGAIQAEFSGRASMFVAVCSLIVSLISVWISLRPK